MQSLTSETQCDSNSLCWQNLYITFRDDPSKKVLTFEKVYMVTKAGLNPYFNLSLF